MILQYVADLKARNRLSDQEVLNDYKKIIGCIEAAYNNGEITIDEDAALLEAIQKTNWYAMKNHQKILKGVEDMVSQTLELKHKKIAQEAAQRATKKTEIEMLMEMKVEGVSKQVIVKMAKKKNIPEEEINKILDSQE